MDPVTSNDRLFATMDKYFESATLHPIPAAFSLLVCLYVLRAAYLEHINPLRNISGPWLAKYTRVWLWKAITSRDWHRTIAALHRQHGPVIRIAPNEYSIDDPEAAKVIFRSRNQLEKFGYVFGSLEKNDDVSGLIETIGAFMRYGMVVGPFVEWHPIIIRLLQALTPGSNMGLLHLKSIGENAMNNMDEYLDSLVRPTPTQLRRRDAREATEGSRHPRALARLRDELDEWAAAKGKNSTVVGMNAYVAHANRDVFGFDADDFRPERWLGHLEAIAQMDQYFLTVSKYSPPNPAFDLKR
ncbi:MAG: hypothetical protein Q9171_004072 [Xanthocarpia ochracea]